MLMDQSLQLLQDTISTENPSVGREATRRTTNQKNLATKKNASQEPLQWSTNGRANNSVTLQAFRLEKTFKIME